MVSEQSRDGRCVIDGVWPDGAGEGSQRIAIKRPLISEFPLPFPA
jgi:hypothetical protein